MSVPLPGSSDRSLGRLLTVVGFLALNTGLVLLLLLAGWWREIPRFWTNAGGYPVLLRALVRFSFWPGWGLDVLLVGAAGMVNLRHRRDHPALMRAGLMLAAMQLLVLGGLLVYCLADNVDNLLNGRPFFDPE